MREVIHEAQFLQPNMIRSSFLHIVFSIVALQALPKFVVANFTMGTSEMPFKCPPEGNLWCTGTASSPSGGRDLILTSSSSTYGMAVRSNPIQLLTSASANRTSISFSTSFRFKMESPPNWAGDGMTFVMLSEAQFQGTTGNAFGVYNRSGQQNIPTLAVEFDTFQNVNVGDISSNHVGVDLENVTSKVSRNASDVNITLAGNQSVYVWIDYDSSAQNLEVRISSQNSKSHQAFLNYTVNLFEVFPPGQQVYVGFSAANGLCQCYSIYTVYDWNFEYFSVPYPRISAAPSPTANPGPETGGGSQVSIALIAGVSAGPLLIIVLSVSLITLYCLCIRREKQNTTFKFKGEHGIAESADSLRFSYKQLYVATAQFQESSKLGQGGFGSVYCGKMPQTGQLVAVKRVSHDSKQGAREFVAEVSIISQIRHRNIVRLLGWCNEKREFLLVYELMPNGSLDKALFYPANRESVLSWKVRFRIIAGAAEALYCLHEGWRRQVIHRDFKSSNIMLDQDFNAMLGDFGLGGVVDRSLHPATTLVAGTYGYIAPEAPASGKFTEKTDVFAFGAVALEIACGRSAYSDLVPEKDAMLVDWVWERLEQESLFTVVDPLLEGNYDEKQVEVLLLLGLLCSHPNPHDRPTMRQVVEILRGRIALPPVPSSKPLAHYGSYGRHLQVQALK